MDYKRGKYQKRGIEGRELRGEFGGLRMCDFL
jgi:hypothetical protein